jgi:hypothetical protein
LAQVVGCRFFRGLFSGSVAQWGRHCRHYCALCEVGAANAATREMEGDADLVKAARPFRTLWAHGPVGPQAPQQPHSSPSRPRSSPTAAPVGPTAARQQPQWAPQRPHSSPSGPHSSPAAAPIGPKEAPRQPQRAPGKDIQHKSDVMTCSCASRPGLAGKIRKHA